MVAWNWTSATLVLFLASIPQFGATIISLKGYLRRNYPYFLYMTITWACLSGGNLLIAISYLTLDPLLYRIGIVGTAPLLFSIMLLVDWVSKEGIDPKKLFIVTAASACLLIFAFDVDGVYFHNSGLGETGPTMAGRFSAAGSIVFLLAGLMWLYYMIKINRKSPHPLKLYSRLNLVGAILAGPGSIFVFASGLVWVLPGTDYLLIGLGALCCAIAFSREPKLGYVLPFKVYRLLTIEIGSGILLHDYTWEAKGLADGEFFSGALTGISALLQETLGQGAIREIRFENGVLLLKRERNSSIAFALIASKASLILKHALSLFASEFGTQFAEIIDQKSFHNTVQFSRASTFIENCFPFVVSYI